jgi:hypothetical protein
MLKNEGNRNWFIQAGRDLLSDLLIQAEKVEQTIRFLSIGLQDKSL